MAMTESERSKCSTIINSHTAAVAAGNDVIFIPGLGGLGFAVNTAALTTMTLALANVFNVSITNADATSIVKEKVKKYRATKDRLRYIRRYLPLISAPHFYNSTVHMIRKVGWAIAEEFAAHRNETYPINN